MKLAIDGGPPVWTGSWPTWPNPTQNLGAALTQVAASSRWAVSGEWTGTNPLDVKLGREFADFVGARHCIPVDHGSSALIIALLSVGVRAGDEVIVSGISWVASASAIARLGAIPILADVDSATQCIDPAAVEAAITDRTTAVIAVHLYSTMADVDSLKRICDAHNLSLVEDCAQAYGAEWDGTHAGNFGRVGCFSTQQGKSLTSGEGGLLITSQSKLAEVAEMYRGDGRRYFDPPPPIGKPSLREFTEVQGWNMHLSEFQAAVLLDGLSQLRDLNARRRVGAAQLDSALHSAANSDFEIVHPYPLNKVRGYYHYAIRLRPEQWTGIPVSRVCDALSAELGFNVHPTYPPLNKHPLYDPRRLPGVKEPEQFDPSKFDLPNARAEAERTVLLHHPILLAEAEGLAAIVDAFLKVAAHRTSLRGAR